MTSIDILTTIAISDELKKRVIRWGLTKILKYSQSISFWIIYNYDWVYNADIPYNPWSNVYNTILTYNNNRDYQWNTSESQSGWYNINWVYNSSYPYNIEFLVSDYQILFVKNAIVNINIQDKVVKLAKHLMELLTDISLQDQYVRKISYDVFSATNINYNVVLKYVIISLSNVWLDEELMFKKVIIKYTEDDLTISDLVKRKQVEQFSEMYGEVLEGRFNAEAWWEFGSTSEFNSWF